ncbi:hypothetical protein K7432_002223 [Basidiobolus ranarum]|uniref:ShKT domain-containing protein n=1 Tax=Basidiobolus ranarum TaxID=34480 RepID=A0ABR2X1X6_9FUNG
MLDTTLLEGCHSKDNPTFLSLSFYPDKTMFTQLIALVVGTVILASSGVVNGECTDTNKNCAGWGKSGECTNNPLYMLVNCCTTCKEVGIQYVQPDTNCSDNHVWCEAYATAGKCEVSGIIAYDISMDMCPSSCHKCPSYK